MTSPDYVTIPRVFFEVMIEKLEEYAHELAEGPFDSNAAVPILSLVASAKMFVGSPSSSAMPEMEEAKSVEQLVEMGGKFYEMNGEGWCDTALDSWKFVPTFGAYLKQK